MGRFERADLGVWRSGRDKAIESDSVCRSMAARVRVPPTSFFEGVCVDPGFFTHMQIPLRW